MVSRVARLASLATALGLLLTASAAAGPNSEGAANPCAFPEALVQAKEDAEARKAYVGVLKLDPSSPCARDGLAALNEPAAESASKKRTDFVEEVAGWLEAIAVAIGTLAVLFFALLFLGYCPWVERRMRRLWLVRRVLAPRLSFGAIDAEAVDEKIGTPMTARIKERLGQMREEALSHVPEYDLDSGGPRQEFADLVSGSGSLKSALESASDISGQAKAVAALLSIAYTLLPIKRFEISGSLEPPVATGAAATLILEQGGNFGAATTLQGPHPAGEKPKAAEYMQLADPAAVWIQYEVAQALRHEEPDPAKAESLALVREGIECYGRGKLPEARARYEKALQLNERNWAAYVGLAVAEARLGEDFETSVRRIEEGLALMRRMLSV